MSWDYLQQKARINQEIVTAIHTAGGDVSRFDINAITEFIFAAQCNNIQVYRDATYGAYHVEHLVIGSKEESNAPINTQLSDS